MKVLFDAYWWIRGPGSNQQVLHAFVETWLREFPDDEVVLAVRRCDRDAVYRTAPDRVSLVTTRAWPHGVSTIVELPLLAARTGADVTLTHNFSPLFGRSAVFLHDVLFKTNPEWFTVAERAYYELMVLTAPRAAVVLTSSHTERRRIEATVRRAERVRDVGLAVGLQLRDAEPIPPTTVPLAPGSFLLTVGRLNVRKNVEFACRAALQTDRLSTRFPLVIAGTFQGKAADIPADVQRGVDDGRIVLLGHVTVNELAWLYGNASGFIFLTLGEGFGLPPLEALSFGTPVLASDIPVMREVLGEHGSYVDPTSLPDATQAIDALISRVADRSEQRRQVEGRYSWQKTISCIRTELASVARKERWRRVTQRR